VKQAFDRSVEAARARATEKRLRVIATFGELRHRTDPRTIIAETAEEGRRTVNRMIGDATAAATSRPWLLALGATLFGIAITLRAHLATDRQDEKATKPRGKS